jgi:hypothetical protein
VRWKSVGLYEGGGLGGSAESLVVERVVEAGMQGNA